MLRFHLFLFCLLFESLLFAQEQVPLFANKADSAKYFTIDQQLKALFRTPGSLADNGPKMDSLFQLQTSLRSAIIGYRYAFVPKYKTVLQRSRDEYATTTELSVFRASKLPKEIYKMPKLTTLEIIESSFARIPKRLNRVTSLRDLVIRNATSKKVIRLARHDHVTSLAITSEKLPSSYAKLRALEKLDLSRNNLDQFPNIKGLTKLKDLNLKNNNLTQLTVDFSSNESLQNIELQYNKIQTVPAAFGSLRSLKKLMLNYNEVNFIDSALANCKTLEQLGLYQNKLTSIPQCLYQLSAIKEIDLYYNEIEKVEPALSNWKKLEILYLSHNRIFSLPDNLGEMTALQELYVSDNRISSLPESIASLEKLRVLRANNNQLLGGLDGLLKLNKIENIDFSSNSLSNIDLRILDMDALKIVVLKANPWDEATKEKLLEKAEELRLKGVVVHLESPPTAQTSEGQK